MGLRFASIASSSSGNCIYVGTEHTNILIDAGLSGVKIEKGLESLELSGNDIDAIFVTHEHRDHIAGVGILSRRYDIPVYATTGTWENMPDSVGKFSFNNQKTVYADETKYINELGIKPFTIPHDAAEPVGYSIMLDNKKVTIATDIGHITDTVAENIKGSNILLLESNHDENMLQSSSYPYSLKKRILGDYGHLSNNTAGKFMSQSKNLDISKLEYLFLGHLSKENNTPTLAYRTVESLLTASGAVIGGDFDMWVAPPEGVKRRIELK